MVSIVKWGAALSLSALLALAFLPRIALAAPDYPWSCRDGDAVMAAARKYSYGTPVYKWDQRKIAQAEKEFAYCLKVAADDEDRFEAATSLTWVSEVRALRYYDYAVNSNILDKEPDRKQFFLLSKSKAIAEYRFAQKEARVTIEMARASGLATDQFSEWVQHNISDRLAEISAMSFRDLKSHSALLARNIAPPKARAAGASRISAASNRGPSCAHPNVQPGTDFAKAPDMPAEAQQQGITGDVTVDVSLDENGSITGVAVESSPSKVLNANALVAARSSKFHTEIKDCKPVAATYRYIVTFDAQ